MNNKSSNQKTIILLLTIIILIAAMFYFVKQQRKSVVEGVINMEQVDLKINELSTQEKRTRELLDKSKEILDPKVNYVSKLKTYVKLPITEEEIRQFIGPVTNPYPFGNPKEDQKLEKQ